MPKGKKKAAKAAPSGGDMEFMEDPTAEDGGGAAPAPAPAGGGGFQKFDISPTMPDGSWRPSGELRKKKDGKGWKKRWCHLVRIDASNGLACGPNSRLIFAHLAPVHRRGQRCGTERTQSTLRTAEGGRSGSR